MWNGGNRAAGDQFLIYKLPISAPADGIWSIVLMSFSFFRPSRPKTPQELVKATKDSLSALDTKTVVEVKALEKVTTSLYSNRDLMLFAFLSRGCSLKRCLRLYRLGRNCCSWRVLVKFHFLAACLSWPWNYFMWQVELTWETRLLVFWRGNDCHF